MRERFRVFIPVFGVIRDLTTKHGGDGAVETFYMAVILRVACLFELVCNSKDEKSVVLQLSGKLGPII